MCCPQIWLCLFTFWPIASKQLNSLTLLTRWCSGNASAVVAILRFPTPVRVLMFDIFVLVLLCFYLLSKNTLFVTTFCNSHCNVYLLSILNISQYLWPIIRVFRYKPSIFNISVRRKTTETGMFIQPDNVAMSGQRHALKCFRFICMF